MKHLAIVMLVALILFSACSAKEEWKPLFNGENLDNWDLHVGTPIRGFEILAASATPDSVFTVAGPDGQKAIRISGHVNASMATKEEFSNYHLQMEFRWADKVYGTRNSGLIYHSYGPFGTGLGTWMCGHELQMKTGSLGDSYRMGDAYCEIPAVREGNQFTFQPGTDRKAFGKNAPSKAARKSKDAEKPLGEWNTIDLYCYGDVSAHVVNGETVMVNYQSGKYEGDAIRTLNSGKIQVQSEGGELWVRSLKIKSIEAIPGEVMR